MVFGGRTETDIIYGIRSMGDAVESALKKPAYDGMRNNSLVQAHRSMQERVKFTKPGGTAG